MMTRRGRQGQPGRCCASIRFLQATAFVAATLSASGCTTLRDYIDNGFKVGPNYKRPPAPVAQHWIDAGDVRVRSEEADDSHWWTVFGDPALNELVQTAYRQNLTLRQAGCRVLEARAQQAVAVGNFFPQFSATWSDLAIYYDNVGRGSILYAALGTPVRNAAGHVTNAVIIMHGTGGTGRAFLSQQFAGELFEPGQPLDIANYFIVLPDALRPHFSEAVARLPRCFQPSDPTRRVGEPRPAGLIGREVGTAAGPVEHHDQGPRTSRGRGMQQIRAK